MKLNDRTVTLAKPTLPEGKIDIVIFDEDIPGFGLRIREGGSRAWIFQYSRDGRSRRMTLGKFPKLSAREAREMVGPLAHLVGLGRDPAAEKQEARSDKETLGEAVMAYLQVKKPELRPRTFVETERYLAETAKGLHGRPLAAINQTELADLLARIAKDSGNATANRFRANLAALYAWAARQGKVMANPVALTEKRPEQSRDRVLTDHELAAIWNALPASDYGAIVKLLMLTGQRRDEIGALRWSEIDLSGDGVIHLPAERTKNRKPHMIPLSPAARDILHALSASRGDREFVFGRGNGFSGWSASKTAVDESLAKMPDWTLHDLRRSAVTGMAELGVAPHVIEAVVNHYSGHKAGIAGVYNRANHFSERREALNKWAAHVVAQVGKPKPVAKPVAKAGASASPRPHKAAA
jgi:integrase